MRLSLSTLDAFLHGRDSMAADLLDAERARAVMRRALILVFVLGSIYGFGMGAYSGFGGGSWKFAVASAVKVPLLLVATTLLCFPALYVFGVAGGSNLRAASLLGALLSAQGVFVLALLALLPVVLFFMSSTRNNTFVKFSHVLIWVVAGVGALKYLHRLFTELDPALARNRRLMAGWMLLFALVGSQAGWMMRPFIGKRGEEFQVVRAVSGNVYADLFKSAKQVVHRRSTSQAQRREQELARERKREARREAKAAREADSGSAAPSLERNGGD